MQNHILEEKEIQFSHPCIGFEKTLQWYEQLFFALFSLKLKKGTQSIKRGPKPLKRSSWGRRDPLRNSEVAKALKKLLIDHHLPPDEQSL